MSPESQPLLSHSSLALMLHMLHEECRASFDRNGFRGSELLGRTVAFLFGDKAYHITGQNILVGVG